MIYLDLVFRGAYNSYYIYIVFILRTYILYIYIYIVLRIIEFVCCLLYAGMIYLLYFVFISSIFYIIYNFI